MALRHSGPARLVRLVSHTAPRCLIVSAVIALASGTAFAFAATPASATARAAAAAAAAAAPASAPTGDFAPFAECPTANVEVQDCLVATFTGDVLELGSFVVPLTEPITFQAGMYQDADGNEYLVAASNGETWSDTPQPVPSSSLKSPLDCLRAGPGRASPRGSVTATIELAGPVSAISINTTNWLAQSGTALELPVKVELTSSERGVGSCSIGSDSDPITFDLTTGSTSPPGPNEPIEGCAGTVSVEDGGNLVVIQDACLVDNSFAVTSTGRCRNEQGSPAGENTVILDGTAELAPVEAVLQSE